MKRPFLLLTLLCFLLNPLFGQRVITDFPEISGVETMARYGDTLFLGGTFKGILTKDSSTRYGAMIQAATGRVFPARPQPDKLVKTVIPDGNKGFYIGGDFTKVGDSSRLHIAHIDSNGYVSARLSGIGVATGTVNALALQNDTLYVGGDFSGGGKVLSHSMITLDNSGVISGNIPEVQGEVKKVIADGSGGFYLGGDFSSIGGYERANVARIDSTGKVLPWNPSANGPVTNLFLHGNKVYICGTFTRLGSVYRKNMGVVDSQSGILLPWKPKVEGSTFSAMAVVGNNLLVMDGGLSAYDLESGTPKTFFNLAGYTANVLITKSILVYGGKIYVGGAMKLSKAGKPDIQSLCAFDASTGNLIPGWMMDYQVSDFPGTIYAMLPVGNKIYASGSFKIKAGITKYENFVQLDTSNGAVVVGNLNPMVGDFDWNIPIVSMLFRQGTLYLGGGFTIKNQVKAMYILPVDTATGNWLTPPFAVNGPINCLGISGSKMFVAGAFTEAGGKRVDNIIAIRVSTGQLLNWNPNINGPVNAITANDLWVYVGGKFTSAGGQVRNNLVALEKSSGLANGWNPGPDQEVTNFCIADTALYVGGVFSIIGTKFVEGRAVFNHHNGVMSNIFTLSASPPIANTSAFLVSGNKLYMLFLGKLLCADRGTGTEIAKFDPSPYYYSSVFSPRSICMNQGKIYAAGVCNLAFGLNGLASFDTSTYKITGWRAVQGRANLDDLGSFTTISSAGDNLYVGGPGTFGGIPQRYFAAIDMRTFKLLPIDIKINGEVGEIVVKGNRLYLRSNGAITLDTVLRSNGMASFDLPGMTLNNWQGSPKIGSLQFLDDNTILVVDSSYDHYPSNKSWARLAKMKIATTSLVPGWNVICSGKFLAGVSIRIRMAGEKVLLGANGIDTVNGTACEGFAAVDTISGAIIPPYHTNIRITGSSNDITPTGDPNRFVIGGTTINGFNAGQLMSFRLSDASLYNWRPNPLGGTSIVCKLVIDNQVYVGGDFNNIGTTDWKKLVMFELDNDYISPFRSRLTPSDLIRKMFHMDSIMVVAGDFDRIFNVDRRGLCAFGVSSKRYSETGQLSRNSYCLGEYIKVPYKVLKAPESGNTFIAQLSDSSGNFTNATIIGTLQSSSSDTILAYIPRTTPYGTKYRIRVLATAPAGYAPDNGTDITIHALGVTIKDTTAWTVCPGVPIKISGFPQGSMFTYQWLRNDTAVQGAIDSVLFTSQAGSYRLRVNNIQNGCTDTSFGVKKISLRQVTPATLQPSGTIDLCAGDSVVLKTSPMINGLLYSSVIWLKNGAILVIKRDSNLTVSSSGVYKAVVVNMIGCRDTSLAANVSIHPPAVANVSPSGYQVLCQNDILKLGSGGNYTFQWMRNGSLLPGATDSTYSTNTGGFYQLIVKSPYNCADTSSGTNVDLKALPTVSLTLPQDTISISAAPMALSGGTPAGGYYTGTGVSGGYFTPQQAGIGANVITYIYTDANGCPNQASRVIVVTFAVGVPGLQNGELSIYPNPVSGNCQLNMPFEVEEATVVFSDLLGRKVLEKKLYQGRSFELPTLSLPAGTYTVTVSTSRQMYITRLLKLGW